MIRLLTFLTICLTFTACNKMSTEVRENSNRIETIINNGRWNTLVKLVTDDLKFTTSDGKSYQGESKHIGGVPFERMMKKAKKVGSYSQKITDITRRDKDHFDVTMDVKAAQSETETSKSSLNWKMKVTWRKVGDNFFISEIKILTKPEWERINYDPGIGEEDYDIENNDEEASSTGGGTRKYSGHLDAAESQNTINSGSGSGPNAKKHIKDKLGK